MQLFVGAQNYVPNQLILQFRNEASSSDFYASYQRSSTIQPIRVLSQSLAIHLVEVSTNLDEAIRELSNDTRIISVQKNHFVKERGTPNDSLLSQQWYLNTIRAKELWESTSGATTSCGKPIVVAVLELNGADYEHRDLFPNVLTNNKEVPNDKIDNDGNGYVDDFYGVNIQEKSGAVKTSSSGSHGTNVAGLIAAKGNNISGVAGVAYDAKLLLVRTTGVEAFIIEGYDYVLNLRKKYNASKGAEGANIVVTNFSAGIPGEFAKDHKIWCDIYDALGKEGILSISATDNQNRDVDKTGDIPSLCTSPYLVVVTNTDQTDKKVEGAAYGSVSVDIAAPGVSMLTTFPSNIYARASEGTSFSTPLVSGAAALLFSTPSTRLWAYLKDSFALVPLYVKEALLKGSAPLNTLVGITTSGGRLDMVGALDHLHRRFGDVPNADPDIVFLYPNPASENFKIVHNFQAGVNYDVKVWNSVGQYMYSYTRTSNALGTDDFDVTGWQQGVYFIQIFSGNKESGIAKFVRQ